MSTLTQLRKLIPAGRPLSPTEARSLAELQAARFRQLTGYADTPLLPSATITSQPRFAVHYTNAIQGQGISGWNKRRRQWVIIINSNDVQGRQRFTLAHELKHIVDAFTAETSYVDTDGFTGTDQAEAACDYFAGCLLVPKHLLKRLYDDGEHNPARLAARFGVSTTAMRVRLSQVGLRPYNHKRPWRSSRHD